MQPITGVPLPACVTRALSAGVLQCWPAHAELAQRQRREQRVADAAHRHRPHPQPADQVTEGEREEQGDDGIGETGQHQAGS
ncbi:MAG TPA: hypothetical protein PKB14_08190 [Rubrivivax sp.]|nr:hypothetical protein [Rubrivivax sp.]